MSILRCGQVFTSALLMFGMGRGLLNGCSMMFLGEKRAFFYLELQLHLPVSHAFSFFFLKTPSPFSALCLCVGLSTGARVAFFGAPHPWRKLTLPPRSSHLASSPSARDGMSWSPASMLGFQHAWSCAYHHGCTVLMCLAKACFPADIHYNPRDPSSAVTPEPWWEARSVVQMFPLELGTPSLLVSVYYPVAGLYQSLSIAGISFSDECWAVQ